MWDISRGGFREPSRMFLKEMFCESTLGEELAFAFAARKALSLVLVGHD